MSAPPSPENPTSNASTVTNDTPTAATSAAPPPAAPETQWSVQSVLATIPTYSPLPPTTATPSPSPSTPPLPFLHLLERLKTTKREGWRRFDITAGESIADHMYRMAIMTMLAPAALRARGLNVPHCTKMALVHDMAESLVGDITPVDDVPKEEKARREAEAMAFLCGGLLGGWGEGGAQGAGMREVFAEYEEGKTLESVFVHDVDKVELLLQMVEYEKRAEGKSALGKQDLGEFSGVAKKVQLEEMKEWCREILKERVEFWKGLGKTPEQLDVTV